MRGSALDTTDVLTPISLSCFTTKIRISIPVAKLYRRTIMQPEGEGHTTIERLWKFTISFVRLESTEQADSCLLTFIAIDLCPPAQHNTVHRGIAQKARSLTLVFCTRFA